MYRRVLADVLSAAQAIDAEAVPLRWRRALEVAIEVEAEAETEEELD